MSETSALHLITRYLGGGAETTTRNELKALSAADHLYDLHLATGAEHDPDQLAELKTSGISIHVFESIRHYNPVAMIVAIVAVARYLRKHDIDIIHTHSTEAGIVGRWAGFIAGTPTIVHEIHGDPITSDRSRILNHVLLLAERVSAPLADRLIVKSERIRETFLQRNIGSLEQYELIYHGVALEKYRVGSNERTSGLDLLYVGRLAEGKGLFDLFESLRDLEDVSLLVAGDGPLYEELERLTTEWGLPVTLLGYHEHIPELLATADVLVLPSYREGTPRVITEAMAAGVPVVSTKIAGIPEQVIDGESGYLIEPGNVGELTAAIEKLRDQCRRQRFAERAQELSTKFSKETSTAKIQSLYSDLLSQK